MKYRTYFKLDAPVIDIDEAREYLTEDDMTQYLDDNLLDYVKHVEWILKDEASGYIEVETFQELPPDISTQLSSWISGQNSDGLGEGFEQQEFAYYTEREYDTIRGVKPLYDDDDTYYDDSYYTMASFDWKTNDYTLEKVEE